MTTKTSLFNKGIYKSNFKRFAWGSILYFVFLFISTGFIALVSLDRSATAKEVEWMYGERTMLLQEYMVFPLVMAIVVPTIVGIMLFRFIHSKKASIFLHSLPVKREAVFVSSVSAGFTLMALPVLLNGLILVIMSLCGYGEYFTVGECVLWIGANLWTLFIMFSCTCFVSSITGNSFAMIALNVIIHIFLLITAAGFGIIGEVYLHGFEGNNSFVNSIMENIFPVKVFELICTEGTGWTEFIVPTVFAVIFYALSFILYRKRRIETAEDVAGFRCLNHIFKYALTFIGVLFTTSAFSYYLEEGKWAVWVAIALIGAIIYFAIEMILKKTFRVWKSYKGFIASFVVFAVFICLISMTDFFGFETRIPGSNEVKSIAVYESYYYDDESSAPVSEDPATIAIGMEVHRQLIKYEKTDLDHRLVKVKYNLKNGRSLVRVYEVKEETYIDLMEKLYCSLDYKKGVLPFYKDITDLVSLEVNGESMAELTERAQRQEFLGCVMYDAEKLSYSQMNNEGWKIEVALNFKNEGEDYTVGEYFYINPSFERSVTWLKENGYWDSVRIPDGSIIYVCKTQDDIYRINDRFNPDSDESEPVDYMVLEGETAQGVIDYINNIPYSFPKEGDTYYVCVKYHGESDYIDVKTKIKKSELEALIK